MAQQQQPPGQSDNSLSFLWIIFGSFAIGYFIWKFFQAALVTMLFKIKLFEIAIVNLFTPKLDPVRNVIYQLAGDLKGVPFSDVAQISDLIGNVIYIPIMIILLILAVILYFSNPTRDFKHSYDNKMQRLKDLECENWPQINPTVKLDLIDKDIDEGPWRMMATPVQFGKQHDLLEVKGQLRTTLIKVKEYPELIVDKTKATQVFAMQLGPLWKGTDKLPIHRAALFGIFAARMDHNRKPTDVLLEQISRSAKSGKLNFKGARALAKKYKHNKIVQRVELQHAFEFTVLATMLSLARTDGVLATADFLWLKPLDRPLWYVLNTVGRQTPPVEIAGIHAHWLAELELSRRLYVPMVQQAVEAYDDAIQSIAYRPEEDEQ